MSRHRAIRNLDINDVLDEDDYESSFEEEEVQDEFDESQLTNEDLDLLYEGLDYIHAAIGKNDVLSDRQIKETLWYYYFNKEDTLDWALEEISKAKALEAKKKAKAKKDTQKKPAPAAKIPKKQSIPKSTPAASSKVSVPAKTEDVEFLSDDEELTKDISAMGLDEKKKEAPKVEPAAKIPNSKRINIAEEYEKRSKEKSKLNLIVIGHVDSGKSTLMGHFLYDLGQVNEKTMRKFERESQKIGKGSFAFAWVLDETDEERDRGITMDIATNYFETNNRQITLLDAPGHRDFIPNMISGTAQADAAILVAPAIGFESGFEAGGQTKEHAVLARSLGVQQLIVAVNKLDLVDWSQERFEEIRFKLNAYLLQIGFKKNNISYVPVSGLTGENLVKKSQLPELTSWYHGPTLMEEIDRFEPPTRLLDKPLRMRVTDFFKGGIGSSGGVSVAGQIEAGSVQIGEQVMVVPGNETGYIKSLQVDDETTTWAVAGDSVMMTLTHLDILNLSNGCVLCTPSNPVPITSSFEAQIVVFDVRVPLTLGYQVVLHLGSLNEPAFLTKLVEVLDKSTGEVVKRNPRCLTKGMTAKVQIKLSQRTIPLETFKDNKQLGRIMLRKGGETVAAGVVTEILSFGS